MLQLDEFERAHVDDLVPIANQERRRRPGGLKHQILPVVPRFAASTSAPRR
jgi:hypothetical protein